MNIKMAQALVRLYPRAWRQRYGEEFEEQLRSSRGGMRVVADVAASAMKERLVASRGGRMDPSVLSFGAFTRRPSAFVPLIMSFAALATVAIGPLIFGDLHSADEGPTAHIWQILMAGQVPAVAFFLVRWLRQAPKRTMQVLAVQAGGVLANLAAIFLLGVG